MRANVELYNEPSWKNTYQECMGTVPSFVKIAKEIGYKYVCHNDNIYNLEYDLIGSKKDFIGYKETVSYGKPSWVNTYQGFFGTVYDLINMAKKTAYRYICHNDHIYDLEGESIGPKTDFEGYLIATERIFGNIKDS